MGLHFILGSSGTGKTTYVYDSILQKAAGDNRGEYILVVPEQFTLQTQKDLIIRAKSNAISNVDAVSFLRLAYRLFEEKGGEDRIILEDTGKSMIVKKVLIDKYDSLKTFADNVKRQGFVDEVKSVISEFSQYDISVDDIDNMIERFGDTHGLGMKLRDIRTVYKGFNDFIEEKYITAEGIYSVMSDAVVNSAIIRNAELYIDGFTGFTPSQYRLVRNLIKYAKEVYITITIDEAALRRPQLEHQLFYLSYNTIIKLEKIAAEENVLSDRLLLDKVRRYDINSGLYVLERNIFRYPHMSYDNNFEDVAIWVNEEPESEIIRTAVEIKHLVKNKGLRYRDIAIVSGDVEMYGKDIALKLEKLGIPSFVDKKQKILTNPAVEMLRSLIEIAEYDFTYEAVFRFLKTGFTDIDESLIDDMENYVIALGIRGRNRYLKKFSGKYRTAYDIDIDAIDAAKESFVKLVMPVCDVLKAKTTVREKLMAIYKFFIEVRLEEKLDEYSKEYAQSEDLNYRIKAKEYAQVYRIIIEVFERIEALLGEDVLEITEFREILDTGLKEAKAGLIPFGVDQIVIGDIERTRLKDIKVLFILGVNDGIIPKNSEKGGILNEADRSMLTEMGIELAPDRRQQAYMTEFYMYLNMTKPSYRLYLSYTCIGGDKKPARSSYIISKVNSVFRGNTHMKADNTDMEFKLGVDLGRSYLAANVRSYYNVENRDTLFELIFRYYMENLNGGGEILKNMISDAFGIRESCGISTETARGLYGSTITGSVTRMEKYAECSFAHFMMYGLKLEERAEFEISMPDIGTIYHNALEMFSNRLKEKGISFRELEDNMLTELSSECVSMAVNGFNNGILESSKRNEYRKERVKRVLLRTVRTIRSQVRRGDFEPWKFEQVFEHTGRFMNIKGRIDRMDIYEAEGKTYVEIVDYKSGSKKFDLESLYYGLSLQLAVYMYEGMKIARKERPNDNILPAGMLYYIIDDPVVERCENPEEKIEEVLRMDGMVNSGSEVIAAFDRSFLAKEGGINPSVKSKVIPVTTTSKGTADSKSKIADTQNLINLADYSLNKMHKYSKSIMAGDVRTNPYRLSDTAACDYCSFSGFCRFDKTKDSFRRLKSMDDDEILNKIKEELGESDNGLD